MYQYLRALQSATLAARDRLNDLTIGTRVDRGLFQIVRTHYDKSGKSTVTPISAWFPMSDVIAELENMQ